MKSTGAILTDSVGRSNPHPSFPLQFFKGVGPARAQALAIRGLREPIDLLMGFPRDWEDRRARFSIHDAPTGEKTTLKGSIEEVSFSIRRPPLGLATARLTDNTGSILAVWFKNLNPRYDVFASLRQRLQAGRILTVFGTVEWGPGGKQLRVEDMALNSGPKQSLEGDDVFHFNRIVPLYTTTPEIPERLLRALIGRILQTGAFQVPDMIPERVQNHHRLHNKSWSLQKIHFPDSLIQKEEARTSLAFEEFLILETALAMLRRKVQRETKPHRYTIHKTLLTPFREHLGFEFTAAQKRVIREIFDDLIRPAPMNRLLQGDVGSGKTIVALCAMLLAVENGGQAVLMAPTEILAEQHALTFARLLKPLKLRVALLTGRQTAAQRKKTVQDIANGHMDLVIGTHAVIQKSIRFANLMLAVIDEQHRFGVEHRSLLRQKGVGPDILVMTATPIPRTLALTLYGDLDVSALDQLPPGRTPIETRHVAEAEAHRFVSEEAAKGRQAYVVYPLVKESDKLELKAVVQEATALRQSVFRHLRVGVMHGQLPSREKETIMTRFRNGELDILMATSIIEVGIDVPNASLIIIEHAERFGLSTLHQLRGRVGRGSARSTCLLIADLGTEEARRRIQIMTETNDGFRLSEEDLALRGPGEVMGVMQHGLPPFKIGHLIRDAHLIQGARHAAEEILRIDPALTRTDHRQLQQAISSQFVSRWFLGSTG